MIYLREGRIFELLDQDKFTLRVYAYGMKRLKPYIQSPYMYDTTQTIK